jgi:hypothetical protein
VVGELKDVGSARALWEQDPFQFQFWAVTLLEAQPQSEQKRGADRGIDGVLCFIDGPRRTPQKVVVQVKGGRVSSPQIRDLKGVVEREKAALGLFISLEEPTREMQTEAASGGFSTLTSGAGTSPRYSFALCGNSWKASPLTFRPASPCTRQRSGCAVPRAVRPALMS